MPKTVRISPGAARDEEMSFIDVAQHSPFACPTYIGKQSVCFKQLFRNLVAHRNDVKIVKFLCLMAIGVDCIAQSVAQNIERQNNQDDRSQRRQ